MKKAHGGFILEVFWQNLENQTNECYFSFKQANIHQNLAKQQSISYKNGKNSEKFHSFEKVWTI